MSVDDMSDIFKSIRPIGFDYAGEAAKAVKKIQPFDVDSIKDESLQEFVALAKEMIDLYTMIELSILSRFQSNMLTRIIDNAEDDLSLLKSASSYDGKQDSDGKGKDAIIRKIKKNYDRASKLVLSMNIYIMTELRKSTEKKLPSLDNQFKELKKEVDENAADMKKKFIQVGVSKHAVFFEDMAQYHKKSEKRWLVGGLIALGYGGIFLFALFDVPKSHDTGAVAIFLISRAMIFSLLGFILFFCGRNYMAHRHNYIVNKHRQNALQTYQAIIAGAISPTAHDVILEQAAKCIFMPLDTGYIKSMNSMGNPVVETIRNVVKSGDGKE